MFKSPRYDFKLRSEMVVIAALNSIQRMDCPPLDGAQRVGVEVVDCGLSLELAHYARFSFTYARVACGKN